MEKAGTWRANRLGDLIEEGWYESEYYRKFYLSDGFSDAIWLGCPINQEAEIFFGYYRNPEQPHFSEQERDLALFALRGLKWHSRQVLLKESLLIANAPLTPTESKILTQLLTGQSEKEISTAMNQSTNTTHSYVKAIYRKFGVTNRPSLMALWMGEGD